MKKITNLFKRPSYGDYQESQHREVYERIAQTHNCSPQHVYEIAHGKRVREFDDRLVREALVNEGILQPRFRQ
jgi:hypothetical protein